MLTFTLPEEKHRKDVLSFYEEMRSCGSESIGLAGSGDYDRWLSGMRNRHTGRDLPEGYVREDFYLCYDGPELVGVFSLKFELTDYLLHFGGHVGYAVRPSRRRKGYARQMLEQGLSIAGKAGMERILCVCDEDNTASEKVIRRCGGVQENEEHDPEEQVTVRRFWIRMGDGENLQEKERNHG